MAEKIVLTHDIHRQLMDELIQLETVERPNARKETEIARGFGDLSENAEYEAACEYRCQVEKRIQALKQILEHAEIV